MSNVIYNYVPIDFRLSIDGYYFKHEMIHFTKLWPCYVPAEFFVYQENDVQILILKRIWIIYFWSD